MDWFRMFLPAELFTEVAPDWGISRLVRDFTVLRGGAWGMESPTAIAKDWGGD